LWHLLFAATLAFPTLIALAAETLTTGQRVAVLGLAAALGVWHWLVLARHPQWWEQRLGLMAGYWVVACGLAVGLATISPSFSVMLYGLYPLMFMTLGWWGIVPIVGLTALFGWALGWASGPAMLTNLLATAGLAMLLGVFVTAIGRQSEQRREALAALAATRAELADAARQAGVMAERERLARELHDTVAQGFISVVTQLESADQALADRPDDARTHLQHARQTARDSLAEVRRSVQDLRPDLLEGASLTQALRRAADTWSATSGVPVEVRATGDPVPLHPNTEVALLRTVQEALANAGRHADASRVVVSLSFLGDTVTLDVDDDGIGFDGRIGVIRDGGGYGLVGMRERVLAVGGALTIESTPGEGTTVGVTVPA
jgi:signal transduction histidine kinase